MDTIIYIIIGLNVIISYYAWKNPNIFRRYCLNPYNLIRNKQYDRIITHAFLHGSWTHLIINMLVLWSFSLALLQYINHFFNVSEVLIFLILYFGAIIASSIYSIMKNKDNINYNAVGASGATSAVVFACIFFNPWHKLYFFGVLPIPGIIFGVIYLIYSYRMAKKSSDNIGHDAHFWGAVFGLFFFIIIKPGLLNFFLNQLTNF